MCMDLVRILQTWYLMIHHVQDILQRKSNISQVLMSQIQILDKKKELVRASHITKKKIHISICQIAQNQT